MFLSFFSYPWSICVLMEREDLLDKGVGEGSGGSSEDNNIVPVQR